MIGELRVCAHNNHPKQHSDPHRPARDPTLHFRFHKFRLYMRSNGFCLVVSLMMFLSINVVMYYILHLLRVSLHQIYHNLD